MKSFLPALVASALLLVGAGQSKADLVFTLDSGVFHATADFAFAPGGLLVTVTNTGSNTADAGQAISQFTFTVNGTTVGVPTAFTELKGATNDFAGHTGSLDDTSVGNLKGHWKFSTSGNTVTLDTLSGGQPDHLIAHTGSTPNSSLAGNHDPSFVGGVQYFFAVATLPATLTSSNISNVTFAFGTEISEQNSSRGTGSPSGSTTSAAPEPSSLIAVLTALPMGLVCYGLRRFGKVKAAA